MDVRNWRRFEAEITKRELPSWCSTSSATRPPTCSRAASMSGGSGRPPVTSTFATLVRQASAPCNWLPYSALSLPRPTSGSQLRWATVGTVEAGATHAYQPGPGGLPLLSHFQQQHPPRWLLQRPPAPLYKTPPHPRGLSAAVYRRTPSMLLRLASSLYGHVSFQSRSHSMLGLRVHI